MDKISGILPATSRVTSVDMKNSGAIRSGMPSFGREVGVTSFAERRNLAPSTSQQAMERQNDMMILRERPKDPKAEIVKKMADNFFMNRAKEVEVDSTPMLETEPTLNARANSFIDPKDDANDEELNLNSQSSVQGENQIEDETPVVGRHLDIQA